MTPSVSPGPVDGFANAPSGTVTFLFTDIQGSTRLLELLREQYAQVLADQRDLLRAAFARHHGHEIDTQGDSFFVAFSRALDAVACVVEAQHALAGHAWPQNATVRVRMGLHTGEPLLARTGYVGMDVNRAARIASAGHGGQVLLSQTTRDLCFQDLPPGTALRSLGEHKLKDIRFPQPIWQLDMEGLPADFPALKTAETEAPPTPGEAPFKGLQYFAEADADLFFGREALTGRLVEAMCRERFLAVIGASGSGKSSLVRAGLVPALRRGGRSESQCPGTTWQVFVLTPTAHPLEALATTLTRDGESVTAAASLMDDLSRDPRSLHLWVQRRLRRAERGQAAGGAERLLLVVDQFEELFTLCHDVDKRRAFVENLLHAATVEGGAASVLLTLRADFYEQLSPYPDLCEAVAQHQQYIGAMNADELRQAIEAPAAAGGWEFSPGLVDLLLHDVGATEGRQPEPGALPLLSHALLETWQRRRGNVMNLRAYAESGGVRGGIARTAERVFQGELTPEQQTIARGILLRLTELGEGTQDTRRRARYEELLPHGALGQPALVEEVLAHLADARLITTGEDGVEVAHEALIREWPTLREWLNADREGLRLHRHLTEAAQEWAGLGRDPGELYRGARLAQAAEWAAGHAQELNALEAEFVAASQAAAERAGAELEAQRQRELLAAQQLAEEQARSAQRLRLRNRLLTGVGVVALVLAVLAGAFAVQSNGNSALAQRNLATAQAAGTDAANNAALAESEADSRATQQAVAEAERVRADDQAELALDAQAAAEAERNAALSRELAIQSELNLTVDTERSILLGLAALEQEDTLEARNALHKAVHASRLRLTLSGHEDEVYGVAYSPDGSIIASASLDMTARLWDAATGETLHVLQGHTAPLNDVQFSPDGRFVATASEDGTAKLWEVSTGGVVRTLAVHTSPVWGVSFSPDGAALATAAMDDTAVKVWDVATGELLYTLSNPAWSSIDPRGVFRLADAVFSPDGQWLAVAVFVGAGPFGQVDIWEVASRQVAVTLPESFDPSAWPSFAFSPDSTRLVTAHSADQSFAVWEVASGLKRLALTDGGNGAIFSPDGRWILTASGGGRTQVWDAETGNLALTLGGHMGLVIRVAVDPTCQRAPEAAFEWCGARLATASTDKTIKVWDISPAGEAEWLTVPGALVAPFGNDQLVTVYQAQDRDAVIMDWNLPTWSGATGQPVPTPVLTTHAIPGPRAVDTPNFFTPSMAEPWIVLPEMGGWAIRGQPDGSVEILDVSQQGQVVHAFCCINQGIHSPVSVSAELSHLTYANTDGTVDVWDLEAGVLAKTLRVTQSEEGYAGIVLAPDSRRLIVMASGFTEIWDLENEQALHTFSNRSDVEAHFTPDGQAVLLGNCQGEIEVLDLETGEQQFTLAGHSGCISDMAFTPDGKFLAVSHFAPITIWDWETHEVVLRVGQAAGTLAFSPDGARLAALTHRPTAQFSGLTTRVYLTRLDDLVALARSRLTRDWTDAECRQFLHRESCP